jgi:hypothetical protein
MCFMAFKHSNWWGSGSHSLFNARPGSPLGSLASAAPVSNFIARTEAAHTQTRVVAHAANGNAGGLNLRLVAHDKTWGARFHKRDDVLKGEFFFANFANFVNAQNTFR